MQRTQLKDLEDRQDRPKPASVPHVRLGQSTNRIRPIKELHDEALKYFEKQALLHERNVLKLVRTLKEIDRLTSVISAMEQSKYNELKFIYPPGTSPFKAPLDVAEMNEAKGTSRRNAMNISHHASNTFIRKVTLQARNAHLASVKNNPRSRFSSSRPRASSSNSKNGQTWAWRTWTAKELTRKQRNITHWKSI